VPAFLHGKSCNVSSIANELHNWHFVLLTRLMLHVSRLIWKSLTEASWECMSSSENHGDRLVLCLFFVHVVLFSTIDVIQEELHCTGLKKFQRQWLHTLNDTCTRCYRFCTWLVNVTSFLVEGSGLHSCMFTTKIKISLYEI